MTTTTFFINVSNHPSSKWSDAQLNAAKSFGDIVDLPFPQIDPSHSHSQIEMLASDYADKIKEIAPDGSAVIHIMGEMTFTFAIVCRLKALGFRCVASTTERKVVEKADNVRETTFEFVQFREY